MKKRGGYKMKRKLMILTDNNGKFLISIQNLKNYTTMNISRIKKYFENKGYIVCIKSFSELDFCDNYRNVYILYETSEKKGGFYKRYIEDIIYFLEKQGAILLPKYEYLKAHHNKVYMELLRISFSDGALNTINSKCYGSAIEAIGATRKYTIKYPIVIKRAAGAGGKGVYCANNYKEYKKYIYRASNVIISQSLGSLLIEEIKNKVRYFLSNFKMRYKVTNREFANEPFVIQTFIEGLRGDYKVLFYGNKYYTLYRINRKNDFRASGSGLFREVPEHEHKEILEFARKLTMEIEFPIIGMDIGYDGKNYHLIEFQMIHIGPYALQASNYWHEYIDGK